MAGAAAMPPFQTIQAFRTAAELSSYEPAELRRTIEEQDARIQAQDDIIEQQLKALEQLEEKLDRLQHIEGSPAQADSFRLLVEISDLKERNEELEEAQEHLEESFDHLFQVQLDFLEEALETLEKLSASPDVKSLYTRAKSSPEQSRGPGKSARLQASIPSGRWPIC